MRGHRFAAKQVWRTLTCVVVVQLRVYICQKRIAFGLAREIRGHARVERCRKEEDGVRIAVKRRQQRGRSRNVLTLDRHAHTFKPTLPDLSSRAQQIAHRAIIDGKTISWNSRQEFAEDHQLLNCS